MKLPDYIREHGDEVCAKRFGVSVRTVASWRRGENFPRAKKASEIVDFTAGQVDMAGIYYMEAVMARPCADPTNSAV